MPNDAAMDKALAWADGDAAACLSLILEWKRDHPEADEDTDVDTAVGDEQLQVLAAAVREQAGKACAWTDDSDGIWQTGCGEAHVFEVAGPVENHYVYCPYCGQHVVEVRPTADGESDDD